VFLISRHLAVSATGCVYSQPCNDKQNILILTVHTAGHV